MGSAKEAGHRALDSLISEEACAVLMGGNAEPLYKGTPKTVGVITANRK